MSTCPLIVHLDSPFYHLVFSSTLNTFLYQIHGWTQHIQIDPHRSAQMLRHLCMVPRYTGMHKYATVRDALSQCIEQAGAYEYPSSILLSHSWNQTDRCR